MELKMKPTSAIKVRLGIQKNGPVQKELTHICKLHMEKYLPYNKGTLTDTAYEDVDKVIYPQKYAIIVYDGVRNGKELHYQTHMHSEAGPHWDRRMVSAEIDEVCDELQEFIRRVA